MSAASTVYDHDSETSSSPAFVHTPTSFNYAVTHVFLPVELPRDNDYTLENELSLLRAVCTAAHAYSAHLNRTTEPRWHHITRMLDNLQASTQSENLDKGHILAQLQGMQSGDILSFFIRSQNAGIVLTKQENSIAFESFEVAPRDDAVENSAGSLICSYPRSAVETSNELFDDWNLQFELASFLCRPDTIDPELPSPPPAHSQYITAVLAGILRCIGRTPDIPRITKRVRDDVIRPKRRDGAASEVVWRRSSLWLLIRVVIQMSVDRCPLGRASYKRFMLFFICTLARDANNTSISSDLLHLMSCKILRRLGKLGSSIPSWLSEMALKTCTRLREILDDRWIQLSIRRSPFRNPLQEELIRDTQLSFLGSREYIRRVLSHSGHEPLDPFHPSHRQRGTIDDFLSPNAMFFEEGHDADPGVTLYDVEQSVEQELDDWLAHVTNVEEACAQFENLMDSYMIKAGTSNRFPGNPEDESIMFLTAIELFVALDKLVLKEIPILADYSPEIPVTLLQRMLLRRTTSLHRLSRAYEYLSARHSQSRPGWSILSNAFTEDSFAVRYYDQSPHLQQLKARIEYDVMEEVAGRAVLQREAANVLNALDSGFEENQHQLSGRRLFGVAEDVQSPFPTLSKLSLHAKVIIFELQCPACFRIWRSAASRILYYMCYPIDGYHPFEAEEEERNLVLHAPALHPYLVRRERPPLSFQIHLACVYGGDSRSPDTPTLRYAIQHSRQSGGVLTGYLSPWEAKERLSDGQPPSSTPYRIEDDSLEKYVNSSSHTSNDVLAVQAQCPMDLSLDEFLAFAHLRSGGSLQWLNILRGLRSRTLNFRRHDVHYLLAQAAFQVGPLDLNTGMWLWHNELQDPSYCDALLDELDSLFLEVGASSIDSVMMNTISLLLNRVLTSSPSQGVSERVIALLRSVRRRAFGWVQELSYNLAMAPTNEERSNLLQDMAATCRSTFNVDPTTYGELFRSAEDVDALLSCAFLISALREFVDDSYSRLLVQRDSRLAHAIEEVLRESILADMSDYGVDLAVGKIFSHHEPSVCRWEHLQHPNTRWFACMTKATGDQLSQIVHFNLLNGALRVGGHPLGGLPRVIRNSPEGGEIFRDQGFFLIPSSLPGMDFTTSGATSEHMVHFSLRGDDLVVRAQSDQTNEVLELIPSSKLPEDLPPALVHGYIHWLNLSTETIEVRPLEHPWDKSSENWKIDCKSGQYRMYKGHETLVDIRSPTWTMASQCFECLNGVYQQSESISRNLLVTVTPVDSPQSVPVLRLSISLPRYGLSFFVNEEEELESRDLKDMVYDEDQNVGTLFGLENLLVLRQKTCFPEGLTHKCIIVPFGPLGKHKDDQFRVHIKYPSYTQPDDPLHFYSYDVDNELGCLVGNGSFKSTQYLAGLHAATGGHMPDPLTGKTGAQAALCLLQSARCRSIVKCRVRGDSEDYWVNTPYPQINAADETIRSRYYGTHDAYEYMPRPERAKRRAAYLFPSNVTALSLDDREDADYLTPEPDSELENVTFVVASVVYRWSTSASDMNCISNWAQLWSENMDADTIALHDRLGIQSPPDLPEKLVNMIYSILENGEGTRQCLQLLFLIPAVVYCSPLHQAGFLSMLIVFARGSQSLHHGYKILDGYRPTEEVLRHLINTSRIKEPYLDGDSERRSTNDAVKHLLKDWPSDTPPTVSLDSRYWDVVNLTTSLQQLYSSCCRNFYLKEHFGRVLAKPGLDTRPRQTSSPRHVTHEGTSSPRVTLDWLLSHRQAPRPPPRSVLQRDRHKGSRIPSDNIPTLHRLFSSLRTSLSFQQEYLTHLDASAQRAREESRVVHTITGENHIEALTKHYAQCRVNYMEGLAVIKQNLGPTGDPLEQALNRCGQWPPITADVLLRCLASTSPINLPGQWKECLISLVLLLLDLQRSRRLLRFALDGLEEEFLEELQNEGCDGWSPEDYPDWLLIQVQGNFLIRRAQAEIAMEMMSPQSGENTVMQVNMGEGKSSVIIPIVAAALANGSQLVRVVVPRVLTAQMFELLAARLGGLADRPIYPLPFSRSPEHNGRGEVISPQIDDLHKILSECMIEHGILLVQPEHVMSLKLMSVEEQIRKGKLETNPVPRLQKLISKCALSPKLLWKHSLVGSIFRSLRQSPNPGKVCAARNRGCDGHTRDALEAPDTASKWLSLQRWIHSHARDILDESDEILHPRFQLIYTIGLQQHMDGYPDRWMITQQVLRLVRKHAYSLSRNHPNSMEYECDTPGVFPHIRIVQASDVGRRLISLIVEDIMAGRLPNFKFQHVSAALHRAIRSFLCDENVLQVPDTVKMVEEYAKYSHHTYIWSGLLLLRGLLASNMLLFALSERRWRVDYGLVLQSQDSDHSQTSTKLAVPYRAKDIPAPNTQFGHPDITIILTCLSHYYAGLNEEQLRISFEILLDQDDPSTEYALWVNEYEYDTFPDSLLELREINLKSSEQWDKTIFPLFTRNQATIDFYLSRVVFPHEAKEFPSKLTASSWDLAEKREKVTTGFSGTNDTQWLLPLSIAQRDLDNHKGTNARVLAYLLQPENDSYMVTHEDSERWTTLKLLQMVVEQQPAIRVFLDVGAQILDHSNYQVAKSWLDIAQDTDGAVYFGEDDELMVLIRSGIIRPLLSSPLSQQLDRCVVYLDHARTRGTDIRFPIGSRAAVTVGPKVTKDQLVQGCMRMRKLGHGHSVMFFAPLEVDQSIRAVVGKNDPNTRVVTVDILCWAIHETWNDIQRRTAHWAQQGMSHKARSEAWARFCNDDLGPDQLSNAWLQRELKSLTDLYEPCESRSILSILDPAIRQRCKDLGVLSLPTAQMEEEQEREVDRERERERELELPPEAEPLEHHLHPDVIEFVKTGVIPPFHSTSAFRPVFKTLERSSAAACEADVWSPFILATADFSKTIRPESTLGTIDQYLRPVQWILSRKSSKNRNQVLVLVSSFEADHLMPEIRTSEHVHLHVYAPRMSQRMKPSDGLKLYSIPPLPSNWTPPWTLIDQLNVFAGQLYLRDYQSYLRLCRFLDIPTKDSPSVTGIQRNLLNIPGSFEENEIRFSDSPLPPVMALLAIRNRGRPFAQTHMGKVLRGQPLAVKDFEPPRSDGFDHDSPAPATAPT